jgi:hypothetical protein
MPTAVFYRADTPRPAAGSRPPVRPRGRGSLCGRHRRPADAFDEEHPGLQPAGPEHRHRRRPRRALPRCGHRLPAPPQAPGRGRSRPRRGPRRAGPAGVFCRRRTRTRRPGPGGPATAAHHVGFPKCSSSTSRSPPRWTTKAAFTREQRVLVADIGGGTSDFSLVRVGPARAAAPSAATTSWPTTACTRPAPTSTAMWNWRPSCRCWVTAPCGPAKAGEARARCPAACTSTWPPGT